MSAFDPESRNFVSAEGRYDKLPALASELVSLPVTLLFAAGGPPSAFAGARCPKNRRVVASQPQLRRLRACPLFTGRVRFGWLPAIRRSRPRRSRLTSLGYCLPPAATWLIADLQSSLRLARADLIQANFAVRRFASAQRCFTSFVHTFFAAAVAVNNF
jgi:hypothetical protein